MTEFLPAQVANAINNGFNPQVYACKSLGLAFAFGNENGGWRSPPTSGHRTPQCRPRPLAMPHSQRRPRAPSSGRQRLQTRPARLKTLSPTGRLLSPPPLPPPLPPSSFPSPSPSSLSPFPLLPPLSPPPPPLPPSSLPSPPPPLLPPPLPFYTSHEFPVSRTHCPSNRARRPLRRVG